VNILGTETNAYFYMAWAIGNLLISIPAAVSTSLFAEGSYREDKLWENVWRGLKMSCLLLVPAVALVLIIADKILLLFGAAYSEGGTDLLRILAASSLPTMINLIYLAIKRVEKKLSIIIGLPLGVMVFSLVLAYILLPEMGISGAGIAWLGSQTGIAAVIAVNLFRKVYRGSNAGQVK
jgi:O-antigen/teichoic acid export membrane protein